MCLTNMKVYKTTIISSYIKSLCFIKKEYKTISGGRNTTSQQNNKIQIEKKLVYLDIN